MTIYPTGTGCNHAIPLDTTQLHQWNVDNNEIYLLQTPGGLVYEIFDKTAGSRWSTEIELQEYSIETVVTKLKECEAVVNFDGSVDFVLPSKKWELGDNKEITLLQDKDDLIWQLFDKTTNRASQTLCLENQELDVNQRVSLVEDSEITGFQSNENQLTSVSTARMKKTSVLDPEQTIDRDSWAITLISCGDSGSDPLSWGGHAAILIEGVANGLFFMKKAHLIRGKTLNGCLFWTCSHSRS